MAESSFLASLEGSFAMMMRLRGGKRDGGNKRSGRGVPECGELGVV